MVALICQCLLKYKDSNRELLMLIYAAGETLDEGTAKDKCKHLPDFLKPKLCLKHLSGNTEPSFGVRIALQYVH